jgi:endogenous inhibitor of DNA gyrase (YacG/DUF329 family)
MPAKPPADAGESRGASKPCPECGKPSSLSGKYVIPGKETDPEDAE